MLAPLATPADSPATATHPEREWGPRTQADGDLDGMASGAGSARSWRAGLRLLSTLPTPVACAPYNAIPLRP